MYVVAKLVVGFVALLLPAVSWVAVETIGTSKRVAIIEARAISRDEYDRLSCAISGLQVELERARSQPPQWLIDRLGRIEAELAACRDMMKR